ncbi:hypothetical protein JNUCC31_06685 [Paenibacillus sp. JNUCC31]|uniref:hypothetical protein n=1 Tax=Paenibacillus sp. JNUCC-31 TaxID=2777983 RepID=UPI00177B734E|nr:hypothetical protein [Paenibacillus sp. JNUCC-31]QOS80584.1 hypothetical protein JNUCC31_06685 [Paenibacillus sp. JNUCC-31]
MNPEMKVFIYKHYLKKGLELEENPVTDAGIIYALDVYQVSARIRKRVARITAMMMEDKEDRSLNAFSDIDERAIHLFYSTGVRKTDTDLKRSGLLESDIQALLRQGFIIRMVQYESDGKTEKRSEYRMGYKLYQLLELKKVQEEGKSQVLVEDWYNALMTVLDSVKEAPAISSEDSAKVSEIYEYHQAFWRFVERFVAELKQTSGINEIADSLEMDRLAWTHKKLLLYVEFVIAVAEIVSVKTSFDWKEIGARHYRTIGGSKRFDIHKLSFLEQFEQNLGFPLHVIGLSSQGVITPVYFAGQLSGTGGFQYPQGFLHATTDLTVFSTHFYTTCRVLWIVENRAVVTRMVAEPDFLMRSDSLVLGIDGQLRSGHRKFIADVLTHSNHLEQVVVWCDVDEAGFVISKNVQSLLQSHTALSTKWILPIPSANQREQFQGEAHRWASFEIEMEKRLALGHAGEQEAEMGGMERWMSWLAV